MTRITISKYDCFIVKVREIIMFQFFLDYSPLQQPLCHDVEGRMFRYVREG